MNKEPAIPGVLITGGSGVLGSELVPRFAGAGYTVRVMSRRGRPPGAEAAIEWAQADLRTGEGLAEAVASADLIVHAASSPFRPRATDIDGTARLLEQARAAGAPHIFFISIVGIDRIPYYYYKAKLEAEKLIEESGLPWSTLRATQFHPLLDRVLRNAVRLPVALLPTDFKFQPVDPGEVAERMVAYAGGGPSGLLPDLGGPEVLTLGQMARAWLKARRRRAALWRLPLPGRVAAGFRRGDHCTPEGVKGSITWREWLQRRYGRQV